MMKTTTTQPLTQTATQTALAILQQARVLPEFRLRDDSDFGGGNELTDGGRRRKPRSMAARPKPRRTLFGNELV